MIRPPYLQKGDKIALVAPAGCIDREPVDNAIKHFEQWGYEVIIGDNVFNDYHIFAARDEQRARDMQLALDSDDIRAIVCVRGGYGAIRIIEQLDYSKFQGNPKWLVGFSDICVLHAKLNVLGIESLHAPMPINFPVFSEKAEDIVWTEKILRGSVPLYSFSGNEQNRLGTAEGELVGGNLSILYSLRGVNIELNKQSKILFIEEINEELYHLDRMMQNLKLTGKLDKLQALIVGEMTNMKDGDPSFGKTAYEIIAEAVEDYDFPVVYGFPSGHGKVNMPIILGANVRLNVTKDECTLDFN
jgi:muramoyltetrapeptide carboxypeptidase